jgi:hypothetical protein
VDGWARSVARFAVPAGVLAGVGVVSSHLFALHDLDYAVPQARTIATTVLVLVGLYLVLVLEAHGKRRTYAVVAMTLALAATYVAALLLPPTRDFFRLSPMTPGMTATALTAAAVSVTSLWTAGYTPGEQPGGQSPQH